MRAKEFLNEVGILGIDGVGAPDGEEIVTIAIPKKLLNIQAEVEPDKIDREPGAQEEEQISSAEENDMNFSQDRDELADIIRLSKSGPAASQETPSAQQNDADFEQDQDGDELSDIVRLSKTGANDPAQGVNHTIAAPATPDVPEQPVFISPLQQQLELQKQQGGKEHPVINQIIDHDKALGSTAGEQPEQSVYHDNPLKDNEFVGASTGAIDKLRNATTTQGADKPWYKI